MKFDKDSTWIDDKELVKVIITDIKMPLLSMIVFMVKWAIAIIPAFIILIFIDIYCSDIQMVAPGYKLTKKAGLNAVR